MFTAPVSRHNDRIHVNCPTCDSDMSIINPLDRLFEEIRIDCSTCGQNLRVFVHLKHGMMSAELQTTKR